MTVLSPRLRTPERAFPALLSLTPNRKASDAYAKARLRDRMDAGIAHEYEEAKGGGSHQYAFEHAPETELPIRHEARELARKIRDGERRRARR